MAPLEHENVAFGVCLSARKPDSDAPQGMEVLKVLARSLEALRLIFMPGYCCAACVSSWRPAAKLEQTTSGADRRPPSPSDGQGASSVDQPELTPGRPSRCLGRDCPADVGTEAAIDAPTAPAAVTTTWIGEGSLGR